MVRHGVRGFALPERAVANAAPNWFASVMGTGIVANAAATLPLQFPGLRAAATAVWGLAAVLLIALTAVTVAQWTRHRDTARGHLRHPVTAHFYGAPAMALMTVGAGALLFGGDLFGERAAFAVAAVLWTLGTLLGLASAVVLPYLAFTGFAYAPDAAFAGWLMPVVPPMVSAATGALLLPRLPAGQWRATTLWGCYGMFGVSLIASLVVITLVWSRLAHHGVGSAASVPTLWMVLGPFGQSVTAANLLGGNAHLVTPDSGALEALGVVFGVPVLGFALLWAAIALAVTVRTARDGLPFGPAWWSFTFPVGTCVTAASALALHTGAVAFEVLAVVLYAGLVGVWATVAVRTVRSAAAH
ncbi:TDT family transporter [Glycomyces sp. NPDC047010]|uniref:TDT family transporter n=1 Tax=Glycomyces sp. NPDC047010 TaxID=3155023 RepID=UPI0033D19275